MICIGKMPANIPLSSGAQDGVAYGMDKRIGIGVPQQTLIMRYLLTSQDELSAVHQPVAVISETNHHYSPLLTQAHHLARHFMEVSPERVFKKSSPHLRSDSVVILIFS